MGGGELAGKYRLELRVRAKLVTAVGTGATVRFGVGPSGEGDNAETAINYV